MTDRLIHSFTEHLESIAMLQYVHSQTAASFKTFEYTRFV